MTCTTSISEIGIDDGRTGQVKNMTKRILVWSLILILCTMNGCKKAEEEASAVSEQAKPEYTTEQLEITEPAEAEVGDIIRMGRLEQDGDEATGAEPVYWDVLDKQDDRILVISHDVVIRSRYCGTEACVPPWESMYVPWERSYIRAMLNGEFYQTVFDEEEKERIVDSVISNPDSKQYAANVEAADRSGIIYDETEMLEDMPDTRDRLFVLSWEEAVRYYQPELTTNENGVKGYVSDNWIAKPSYVVLLEEYENQQKSQEEMSQEELWEWHSTYWLDWMLRSQGLSEDDVLCINVAGSLSGKLTIQTPSYTMGVRPAMWVRVE